MKIFKIFGSILAAVTLVLSCSKEPVKQGPSIEKIPFERSYKFYGSMSKNVLESYLSRAITQANFCVPSSPEEFEENFRMIKNIGAKFIGRAAFEWTPEMDNDRHFENTAHYAALVHEQDPEIIIQACIFEAIFKTGNQLTPGFGVDRINIPAWVFEEFGLPVEKRNFNYEAMLFPNGKHVNQWVNGASAPDITQLETQLYYYYRAVRYIDAGVEAIHWGQIFMTGETDKSDHFKCFYSLLDRVRKYAADHARRGFVLCDAHAKGGVAVDGKLLLDFHSFPLRPQEVYGKPYETILVVGRADSIYRRSRGGVTPSGWSCEHLPYLVEFDNSGCDYNHRGQYDNPHQMWPWGWDEILWFSHCTEEYRNSWLEYAYNWLQENDPVGKLQVPGKTTIAPDPVEINGQTATFYRINMPSEQCPTGFGQEETVKKLWSNE